MYYKAQSIEGLHISPGVYLVTSHCTRDPGGSHDFPFCIQGVGKVNSQSVIKMRGDMNMLNLLPNPDNH